MIREEDDFWQLFVNPPCYNISPWKGITQNERNELMMILNWVLHSNKLLIDAYEVILNKKQHKKFKHYISGEHAINYHLKNDLNFKKPLTYKTIDIHFTFDSEFKARSYLPIELVQDLIDAQEVDLSKVCKGWFRNHPLFFQKATECASHAEDIAYSLSAVLKKHETFIKSRLDMMKLELIRPTVVRDSDVLHLPLKKTCFRVGLEINNPQQNAVFFWSVFTLRVDWKEALIGKTFNTEQVTMINMLPPNAPVNSLVIEELPLLSFKEINLFMDSFENWPKTQDKHYDSILSNPNNSFMKKRHQYLKQLYTWCTENLLDEKKLTINEIETSLDKMKESKAEKTKHKSDYWYLEYQDFEYDKENDMLKIKSRREDSLSGTDTDVETIHTESVTGKPKSITLSVSEIEPKPSLNSISKLARAETEIIRKEPLLQVSRQPKKLIVKGEVESDSETIVSGIKNKKSIKSEKSIKKTKFKPKDLLTVAGWVALFNMIVVVLKALIKGTKN